MFPASRRPPASVPIPPRRHRARPRPRRRFAAFEALESRRLLSTFVVTNTLDNGDNSNPTAGSLRAAIVASNAATPGPNNIVFNMPASTAADLDVPVAGFDPITQDWTITLADALPTITNPVDIDGFSQAHTGLPYRYPGEIAPALPTYITSAPNATAAIDGNNAKVRVIVDGSRTGGATGFVLDTSGAILRGLAIDGFGTAVSVPRATDTGNLIQGNYLGMYFVYPVDPTTGDPLPAPNSQYVAGWGNSASGAGRPVVDIYGTNTTLGGASPQDDNVIAGNGTAGVTVGSVPGVVLEACAQGCQVLGNQVGIIGPSSAGVYYSVPNDGPGIVVESSSNRIGASGAGNLISSNLGDGVLIVGSTATQNAVAGNYIGTGPGGGYVFGNGNPGNQGDGVDIQGAAYNSIGGTSSGAGNVISGNAKDGVSIGGAAAVGNVVSGDIIGLISDASAVLGNAGNGVAIYTSNNQVGPGDVISANTVGVLISGATVAGVTVVDDLIGTDGTGAGDLGNQFQGILIKDAHGVTIRGDAAGSQVISGNNVGIEIAGATAMGNLIEGSLIGSDKAGTLPLPNAQQGILIDQGSSGNTIGGASTTAMNLISANHWGVVIDGPAIGADLVIGNRIGTDLNGQLPLGNEIDGVLISASSGNTIGGRVSAQGNTIAFNTLDGVDILSGNGNAVLTDSIFSNGRAGIDLNGTSNDNIGAPQLDGALSDSVLNSTEVDGTYAVAGAATFLIQFFSNPTAADDEGRTYLGSTIFRSDPAGNPSGSFTVDLPLVAAGLWITATSTYLLPTPAVLGLNVDDTSAFSGASQAIDPFLVTSTADAASSPALGTLRYAITYSNAHPGPSGVTPNPITFDIPGTDLQTIELAAPLPTITAPISIDGYTQAGAVGNDANQAYPTNLFADQETDVATLTIQIDGSLLGGSAIAGTAVNGLTLATSNSTIDGLIITGFSGAGIAIEPASSAVAGTIGDTIWGNFLGVSRFNPQTFSPVNPAHNPEADGVGLLIDGPSNLIGGTSPIDRNLIQGNLGVGVILYGDQGTRNTLASNFILDNGGDGVLVLSADNQIGEATTQGPSGAGNVISGNAGNGVHILGPSARGNVVVSDEIGTQIGLAQLVIPIRGTKTRPNGGDGILIENAPANILGGQVPASGNVIGGNTLDGVAIENYDDGTVPAAVPASAVIVVNSPAGAATGNLVQGNDIGFNERNAQAYPLPNRDGVFLSAASNVVGGNTSARNIIVDNNRNGVTISSDWLDNQDNVLAPIAGAQPELNVVKGNYIGTRAGNDSSGNALDGILIEGAGDNTIGGTGAGAGNVISANTAGVVIQASGSAGNVVAGNIIGLTADGTARLGNANDGVAILDAPTNVIGGTTAPAANVIAANGVGVHINGPNAIGNLLQGNSIGTNSGGSDLLGNASDGVAIDGAASGNMIGGTIAGAANTIAFNGGVGVAISSGTGNAILSNSIVSNAQRGIVLTGAANDAQAAPTLQAAVPTTTTLIEGSLTSAPSTSFLVQFFSNVAADRSGFGQGQTLVGSTSVTTGAGGIATFNLTLATALADNLSISATATNLATGDTSAFSNDVLAAPVDVQFGASTFTAGAASGSATITVTRTGNLGASFTVAYGMGGGTASAGVDYTPAVGTLRFGPGQTSQSFSVPILARSAPSGDLTVGLALSQPTAGATLGSPASANLTIADPRPIVVEFDAPAYTADESAGSAVITVVRNSPAGSSSVAYTTVGGTAVPGVEYTPTSGTITFGPGQTSATFTVPLAGLSAQAGQWTVDLRLGSPQGASLGAQAASTLNLDAEAGTLQFNSDSATVPSRAANLTIAVDRVGGANGTISVAYSADAMSAIPGVDFVPASGMLVFPPGVTRETFTLPILGGSSNPYDATVRVGLAGPTAGAVLGSPASEIVTISKPPIVVSERITAARSGTTAITFGFNKPLDPARAGNLANYGAFVVATGSGGVRGPAAVRPTPIGSAIYDPGSRTVTLILTTRLRLNHLYRIVIDGLTNPLLNNGLTDAGGVLLAGAGGVAGTPYASTIGVGTRLAYTDARGNAVSLRLHRGGLMVLSQSPDGQVQRLELVGTVPGRSTLTGSVRRGRHPGRTTLPPISGASGVRNHLSRRSFGGPV